MTLSVVIPAFNAADTLADTLDSLLAQTRRDWEAIVVDDGSIDATRQVGEDYAARDDRIRLLGDGRTNQGASAARNRGIDAATGKWLHFLDADDWVEPTFVAKMLGALEAHPGTRVVYCSACNVTADGRVGIPWLSGRIATAPFETLARECPLLIHSVVIERALVVELGRFELALRTGEDGDLWQRVARTGTVFRPVPEALVYYRARRDSLSTDMRRRFADGRTVIARGFSADPRVPRPDPRFAAGVDGGVGKEAALAFSALWSAAFDVGEGGTGDGLLEPLPRHAANLLAECHVRIVGGLAAGARLLPEDPLPATPAFVSAVRGLLQQVEQAAGRPGLAQLLDCALEPEIFRPAQLTERRAVGNALFVRQEVDRLEPIEAPPGCDRLFVEFRKGARTLGRAEALLPGVLPRRDLVALAIEAMSPRVFLAESSLPRRPRFWLSAAIAATRVAAPFDKPRVLARKILIEAAENLAGPRTIPRAQRLDRSLPILMYHRIAEDGPTALARYRTSPASFAAQMKMLHDKGYRPITSADLANRKALEGRPILISFDDGYRDFHDTAWPILRAQAFTAEVMVVTDLVGGAAEWDAAFGDPAPLMDWPQIRALGTAGVRFGSHMTSHSHMADLSVREIVAEVERSRAALEENLGTRCLSIAAPFGEAEPGFIRIAAQAGYKAGFGTESGAARPGHDLLQLPRIEVQGGWTIERFAEALGES